MIATNLLHPKAFFLTYEVQYIKVRFGSVRQVRFVSPVRFGQVRFGQNPVRRPLLHLLHGCHTIACSIKATMGPSIIGGQVNGANCSCLILQQNQAFN